MDCKEVLALGKKEIDSRMQVYLEIKKKEGLSQDPFLRNLLENVEDILLSGGKRLRGTLLHQGYLAGGGTRDDAAWQAALGIEFLHAYILIHDDIMDQDVLRHGVPTLHVRYSNFAKEHFPEKNAEHFGEAIAITLGDMVCAWANDCIFSADLEYEYVKRALIKIQEIAYRTGAGQIRDMYIEFRGDASEEEIIGMYRDKTAYYTIEAPLQVGLVLAGGDKALEKVFHDFATPLGIAFQLQDDLLGLFADEKKTGKTMGADIKEGKYTLVIHKTKERVDNATWRKLEKILTLGEDITQTDISWVCQTIIDSGARSAVESLITGYITEAKEVIERADILPEDTKDFLKSFAEFLEQRKI